METRKEEGRRGKETRCEKPSSREEVKGDSGDKERGREEGQRDKM